MNISVLFRTLGFCAVIVLSSSSVVSGQTVAPALSPAIKPPAPRIPSLGPAITPHSKGAATQSVEATLYNSGDPSVDEQYYLELLNHARMNPAAAGDAISKTTDPDVSEEFTYWATQDADEPSRAKIKSDFATYEAKQPLAMNASLLAAARAHSQDMLDHNYQGHQGTDGSWPWDRAKNAGYASQYVGENAAAYAKTVYDAYAGWLIDFGVPNDTQWGHRNNCLEFKTGSDAVSYTECGPGMIHGGNGIPDVGPLVSTLDLGDAGKHFILGVVYNDVNKNGSYDPGEGVSGVTINVSSGTSYYAVSATQGGYAIPFTGSGTVTVKATGGPFGTTGTTQSVDLNGENVKVDFIVNGLPGSVTLDSPSPDTSIGGASVTLKWEAQTGATHYHLQLGTDSLMTKSKLIINDSTTISGTTTSKSVTGLKDSTVYYWRMSAQNSKGWGPYGPVQAFTVYLPLPAASLLTPMFGANVGSGDVQLTWRDAGPRATNYLVQVSNSQTMKPLLINDTLPVDGFDLDTVYNISADTLKGGTTYYWQVLVQDEAAWSAPQTPLHTFITGASGVADGGVVDQAVTLSPNPSNSLAHLRFTLVQPAPVSCRIFNDLGQQVRSIEGGIMSGSAHDMPIAVSDLAAGNYSYLLRIGDKVTTGHLVIVK